MFSPSCPHLNLGGSYQGDRVVTGSLLKDERSDDEGEESDDESSALKRKKDS